MPDPKSNRGDVARTRISGRRRVAPLSRLSCIGVLAACIGLGATPVHAADSTLELHVLDCGTMSGMPAADFLPGVVDAPEHIDMVNRCFLIVHPSGTLLWDAGLPGGFSMRAMAWLMWATSFGQSNVELGPSLVDQLAEKGMTPADIDYLAFSHVHFDHVGQAEDFPDSTWLVQKIERDWVFDPDFDNDAVFLSLVEPMRDSETVELEGDHDVFGDGRVRILSAPGHTPGHQCLFIDLPESGPLVLSGDLYHSLINREKRVPPSFNTDAVQSKASMARIERFLERSGSDFWIQHAPESGLQAPATLR